VLVVLQVSELSNQMQAEREGRVRAERGRQLAEQALEKLMNELDRMRAAEKSRSEMEDKFRQQVRALLCC
jgi:coenzyme F420-reducing hydrogenase delta subunit